MMDELEQMDFAAALFPGRTVLYVNEVAAKLEVTDRHVCALIEEGKLEAVDVGGGSRKFFQKVF